MERPDLSGVEVFGVLTDEQREEVAGLMQVIDVPIAEHVIHEGDYAYKFYAILEGAAVVSRDGAILTTLGPGDSFGEVGTRSHGQRNADVVAATPMKLGVLMTWDLAQLAESSPDLARILDEQVGLRTPSSG